MAKVLVTAGWMLILPENIGDTVKKHLSETYSMLYSGEGI